MAAVLRSKYGGTCTACRAPFGPGTTITAHPAGGWRHATCPHRGVGGMLQRLQAVASPTHPRQYSAANTGPCWQCGAPYSPAASPKAARKPVYQCAGCAAKVAVAKARAKASPPPHPKAQPAAVPPRQPAAVAGPIQPLSTLLPAGCPWCPLLAAGVPAANVPASHAAACPGMATPNAATAAAWVAHHMPPMAQPVAAVPVAPPTPAALAVWARGATKPRKRLLAPNVAAVAAVRVQPKVGG